MILTQDVIVAMLKSKVDDENVMIWLGIHFSVVETSVYHNNGCSHVSFFQLFKLVK